MSEMYIVPESYVNVDILFEKENKTMGEVDEWMDEHRIVLCRDCMYAGEQGLNGCQRWWSEYISDYPRLKIPTVDPNGFCAWGWRKCE